MKVLVADDDAISRRRLEKRLTEWGYEAVAVDDGEHAWSLLQGEEAPTLAILDWMMPGLDGPEICSRLRTRKDGEYTYVILLTGKSAKEDVIRGLEAGADDYVTKPFDAQELAVRLRIGKRILAMQHELRERATRDPLTGALNRGAVLEALRLELSRARRPGGSVSVLLLDVDHFKRINDEHGHPAGDEVLREIVRRLTASLRPHDSIGRYGGEEFLVVLPGSDAAGAAATAERLRDVIASHPVVVPACTLPVTVSFGLATCAEEDSLETVISHADEALYAAKRDGRNRVATATRRRSKAA